MGQLKSFQITLNNVTGLYFAGQTVDGYVTVELNQEMKIGGIYLTFYGGATVQWLVDINEQIGSYDASELYFCHMMPVYGEDLGDLDSLQSGRHTFPFSFILPSDIPSSYEGEVGYVRYTVKAIIEKPWKFNHNTEQPFTVVSLLDLNVQPNAANGAKGDKSKTLCCLCCESGPISGKVWIDRIGYVPGEVIEINAELENLSNRVCQTSAKLTMHTTFYSDNKITSYKSTKEVARLNYSDVYPDEDVCLTKGMKVPPLPPSFLAGCNIIDIEYVLEFIIVPSDPAFKLSIPLEIIIGTIPLKSAVQRSQHQSPPSTVSHSEQSAPLTFSTTAMPDLTPPSYSGFKYRKVNIKEKYN